MLYRERFKDPIYKEKIVTILKKSYADYLKKLTAEEKGKMQIENKFTKKFDKCFDKSPLSKDFYCEKEYVVERDKSYKSWDYAIFNKKDKTLECVLDLDGEYYHGDKYDYDGSYSREENDTRRGLFIPDRVKVCIIQERMFIDGFNELYHIIYKDYDTYIDDLFKSYKHIDFPYPMYNESQLNRTFRQLTGFNTKDKHRSIDDDNRIGDWLIFNFHHSIWSESIPGKISPYDAWYNDKILREMIESRIFYRSTLNKNKMLQGFILYDKAPRVPFMSAGRAKMIIDEYLSDYNEIFDPFIGYGGVMLATIVLNKKYVGIDISDMIIKENLDMIKFLKLEDSVDIRCQNILKTSGAFQSLFTVLPRIDDNMWTDLLPMIHTYDDWIKFVMKRFSCKRYVFIVPETTKYKDKIAVTIDKGMCFRNCVDNVVIIDNI